MTERTGSPVAAEAVDREILNDLNPEQRQAVTSGDGPLLIVAPTRP